MPPYIVLEAEAAYFVRIQLVRNVTSASGSSASVSASPMTFELQWKVTSSASGDAFVPVPASVFAAVVPPAQQARLDLQRSIATGWGTWYRDNALASTLLPEGETAPTHTHYRCHSLSFCIRHAVLLPRVGACIFSVVAAPTPRLYNKVCFRIPHRKFRSRCEIKLQRNI